MLTFPVRRGGEEREGGGADRIQDREKEGGNKEERMGGRGKKEDEKRERGRVEKIVKMVEWKEGRRRQGKDAGKVDLHGTPVGFTLSGPTTRLGKPPG